MMTMRKRAEGGDDGGSDDPSSYPLDIKLCLQDIVKYDLLVKAYIQDIRECAGFGSMEDLNCLNMQVGEHLRNLKDAIDALERLGKEEDKELSRQQILAEVESHRKQLQSNQVALRQANLTSQLQIEQRNKEQLLGGGTPEVRRRLKSDREGLVKTSSGITDHLVSLSNAMANQVKQSEETLQSLVHSSTTVGETHEEFKNMSSVIQQSRKLLTKYNRREVTDKVLIFLASAFFFACVLYVIKKRIF